MIHGEKVILRALEPSDATLLHKWMNDPDVTRYLGMRFPMTLAQEQEWASKDRDPKTDLALAIETLDGQFIGSCGLGQFSAINRSASLGISIGDGDYRKKGYGTDVMVTLCAFGFAQMNLNRIELQVFEENAGAVRCYEKVGFQHVGRLREAVFKHGRYHYLLVMDILEREFREKWPERM